jgi:hypothetical protein
MSGSKQLSGVFLYLMVLQLPLKPLGTRYWRSFQMLTLTFILSLY